MARADRQRADFAPAKLVQVAVCALRILILSAGSAPTVRVCAQPTHLVQRPPRTYCTRALRVWHQCRSRETERAREHFRRIRTCATILLQPADERVFESHSRSFTLAGPAARLSSSKDRSRLTSPRRGRREASSRSSRRESACRCLAAAQRATCCREPRMTRHR